MHFHSNIDITHNRYPTTWADVAQARIAFMVWRAPPGRYSGSSRDAAASALHRVTGMDLVEIRAIPRADAADWLACHNDSDYQLRVTTGSFRGCGNIATFIYTWNCFPPHIRD